MCVYVGGGGGGLFFPGVGLQFLGVSDPGGHLFLGIFDRVLRHRIQKMKSAPGVEEGGAH